MAEGVIQSGRDLAVGGNPRPIACLAREGEVLIVGASGRTEFSRLFVSYLWVAEHRRGCGLGTETLRRLESEAEIRGCTDALIETLSDRTARLYTRIGYERVAMVPRYVGQFTKHILIKPI
ncbi:MAG: GNAT family N-acetyltransferase [Gammaproteobacteria bacterium]|nr:GNAT family N-acetyltransferase [Gammaproteobacteria bacterium]MDH3468591.1 GNAT family N-acetyltransferase [Gammaproteobacteria bacterium]